MLSDQKEVHTRSDDIPADAADTSQENAALTPIVHVTDVENKANTHAKASPVQPRSRHSFFVGENFKTFAFILIHIHIEHITIPNYDAANTMQNHAVPRAITSFASMPGDANTSSLVDTALVRQRS